MVTGFGERYRLEANHASKRSTEYLQLPLVPYDIRFGLWNLRMRWCIGVGFVPPITPRCLWCNPFDCRVFVVHPHLSNRELYQSRRLIRSDCPVALVASVLCHESSKKTPRVPRGSRLIFPARRRALGGCWGGRLCGWRARRAARRTPLWGAPCNSCDVSRF